MPKTLRRNAVIAFGLAALFYWAFMFAKHDPELRSIIPFGDDPYDAVGSFGSIVAMLIALLSLVRAFRPYRKSAPSNAQRVYLIRSQQAVVLAVLITVGSDAVAMARHPSLWIGAAGGRELLALLGVLAVVALGVQWLIRRSQSEMGETRSIYWGNALFAVLLATSVLALYPEQLIQRTATHLVTVVMGAFVLFASMRVVLTSLVPYKRDEGLAETARETGQVLSARQRWSIAIVVGIVISSCAFLGELSEGGGSLPLTRLMFVASVFVGLGLAGILVAYAFLGPPLGLAWRG